MTTLKKIQTGISWDAHVKKESLDGATQNPADTCCPSDNKWYLAAPWLRCEFISYSNYVEAPKKCNYDDKPVGPNVSIALGGSIFLMRHLLAYGHRPGGSRLSASPCTVLSRFLSFVQHVHKWQTAPSQRAHKGAGGDPTTWGSALLLTKLLN